MAGRAWSRRGLLVAGGAGLLAAGCTRLPELANIPAPTASASSTAVAQTTVSSSGVVAEPASVQFDLTGRVHASFREVRLHEAHHSLQGIGYDIVNRRTFAVQAQDGRPGADLCINQLSASGKVLAHMDVDNAGHGQSFGVETVGSASCLWFECDATENSENGRGTGLARFEFVPGKKPQARKYLTGSAEIGCAVDPMHHRLLVRRLEGNEVWYRLYRLSDAAANDFSRPLAAVTEPPNRQLQPDGRTAVLQAFTVLGTYVYTWLGTGGHSGAAGDPLNSYLSAIDLRTGKIVQQQLITAGRSLMFREPEALGIDVLHGVPRLCFGFASRPGPSSPVRLATVYYLDTLL